MNALVTVLTAPTPTVAPVAVATTVAATTVPPGSVVQVVQSAGTGSSGVQIFTLFAAGIAAFAAVVSAVIAGLTQRKTGVELDIWRKREETMRLLRWAVDHAVKAKSDPLASSAGQIALDELKLRRNLVQDEDVEFINKVIDAIVDEIAQFGSDDSLAVRNPPANPAGGE